MQIQRDVLACSLDELKLLMVELDQKPYRAKQLFEALHQQWVIDLEQITCFSKELREKLSPLVDIPKLTIVKVKESSDGTRKYQIQTHDGKLIESVFIPNAATDGRNTLCISSQVGCAMGCKFCATAALKLSRNLTASEIIGQVYAVNRDLRNIGWKNTLAPESEPSEKARMIHNLVYMGMGEPLHNYDHVLRSIQLLCAQEGQNYSGRRITVSTSGIVKNIQKLGAETNVHIAISFNATTNELRDDIMPVNLKWPLEDLVEACRAFPLQTRRRITFEYVMLADLNDTDEDAYRLINWLSGIKCKVNLIPFNPHPLSPYRRPSLDRIKAFQHILLQNHMTVFIRGTRGDDIDAACGMLGAQKLEIARNVQN
ncbi:MAG: 23S rRNA (adenine(2503)-C(2))-methyltransferase RlmN [Myxococcaceae bacterium]|nr:23S rRNA (adenine(2503)-C(2))-methyltransferase RlmN [Myxococcaceae bacterium]